MPAVIELRLCPDSALPARFEPTTRQLHGLACTLFEGTGTDHGNQEKAWTVWPLRRDGDGWLLRAAWLRPGFPQQVLAGCGQVRLGPIDCKVTDIAFRPITHDELADVPPVDGVRLTLFSPAYFSQSGQYVSDPDVRLIAGSWRRRWNASLPPDSGLFVDAELWRDIHLALHITGDGLQREIRDTGYRAPSGTWRQQEGLTGTATLRLESGAPAEVRKAFAALARFAEYCGTGAQVTHGFGATRATLLQSSWSASAKKPADVGSDTPQGVRPSAKM
jgi:CRISPR-associated endoribonuclease Cas6